MFDKLPDGVICTIFDSTSSLSTSTKLSQCSRRLSKLWKSHLDSLNLAQTFDDDPRWRGPKYRFFAVSIARAMIEDAGKPLPSTNEAIKAGYKIAGIVNATVQLLLGELRGHVPEKSDKERAAWSQWLEYLLAKSLYMLWISKLTGGSPCDPEYWIDAEEMVAFLLQPRWALAGYPGLMGVKGVTEVCERAPVELIARTCVLLDERVHRNRKMMGAEWTDDEDDEEEKLPLDFYDDTDLDDMEDGSDEGEFESDDEFADSEDDEELGYHKGYADEE